MKFKVGLPDIEKARERLSSVLKKTPLVRSGVFGEESGNDVYIKPENLQTTGAFKIRGAYNKICQLTDAQK